MRNANFRFGNDRPVTATEAQSQFVNKRSMANNGDFSVEKLKQHNFNLHEQKTGGQVNNYFKTSNNTNYNPKGNAAEIRAVIPEQQKRDAT